MTATRSARPELWVAYTALVFAAANYLVAPRPCEEVEECAQTVEEFPRNYNAYAAAGLAAVMLHEFASLARAYRGTRDVKEIIPELRSRVLPSVFLSVAFGGLMLLHLKYASGGSVAHAMPHNSDGLTVLWRPVYTATYIEWVITVPFLFLLSGYCALGRPLSEMAGPVVVTNVYIIFCWAALLSTSAVTKWCLIAVSLSMYAWASREMMKWVWAYHKTAPIELPGYHTRPLLTVGLIALFFVYGILFTAAAAGLVSANMERLGYVFLDTGSKLAFSATFVVLRADEYHETLTSVLKKVSVANVGMVSLLRGSFDLLLPCFVTADGTCRLAVESAADMAKLESMLGRPVAGVSLGDLMVGAEEKETFTAYVRNTLRQAKTPQNFSSATLSTQGGWSCDGTQQMPPVAQVANCRMQMGNSSQVATLDACVHLSVVPQSKISYGEEAQMIAAIRIAESTEMPIDMAPEASAYLEAPCFERFKAGQEPDDEEYSSTADSRGQRPVYVQKLVASLADIAWLGVSSVLQGSVCSESEPSFNELDVAYGKSSTIADDDARSSSADSMAYEKIDVIRHRNVTKSETKPKEAFASESQARKTSAPVPGKSFERGDTEETATTTQSNNGEFSRGSTEVQSDDVPAVIMGTPYQSSVPAKMPEQAGFPHLLEARKPPQRNVKEVPQNPVRAGDVTKPLWQKWLDERQADPVVLAAVAGLTAMTMMVCQGKAH